MGCGEARAMPGLWNRTALAENPDLADFQGPGFSYRKVFMSLFTELKGRPASGGGTSMSSAITLIANRGCLSQWPYCVWGMSVVGEMKKVRKYMEKTGADFYLWMRDVKGSFSSTTKPNQTKPIQPIK